MELLEELLGFVVLTGPLFLIVLWLPLSFWVATKLSKRFRGRRSSIPVGVLLFLLILLNVIGVAILPFFCCGPYQGPWEFASASTCRRPLQVLIGVWPASGHPPGSTR